MRAVVYSSYGSPEVLRIEEVEKPVPKDNEVLIKVGAAALNALDWRMMRGKPFPVRLMGGLLKPRNGRPGVDVAGTVEALGAKVTQFSPGDEVFGVAEGACAEYVCAAEDKLALKPRNVSFGEAAAVPVAAITALQGLRDKGRIKAGQKVLIDGASGGVGTFAVQLAKSFGAEVTAVCSTSKMETAQSIGADHVIDYTRDDFTKSGERYDLIISANAHHSIFDYRRALNPNGIYVMAGGGENQMLQALSLAPFLSLVGGKKMRLFIAKMTREDLGLLRDLLAAGKIVPVIENSYPLSQTVKAMRYLEAGHARGKLVITLEHDPNATA